MDERRCLHCREYRFRCIAPSDLCLCPKCQGYCRCDPPRELLPEPKVPGSSLHNPYSEGEVPKPYPRFAYTVEYKNDNHVNTELYCKKCRQQLDDDRDGNEWGLPMFYAVAAKRGINHE